MQSISKHYQTFVVSDSSDVILIALGINPENVADYKYRVVENDSNEVVPWSSIPKLEKNYGAKTPYGFIGKFKAPGRRLMVEVASKKDYSIREGVIFDWRVSFRPILSQIILATPTRYFNVSSKELNKGYASRFDRYGVPVDLKFPADTASLPPCGLAPPPPVCV